MPVLQATGKDKDDGQDGRTRRWTGRKDKDNGQDGKDKVNGQDVKAGQRAGQARQDMGRTDRNGSWAGRTCDQRAGQQKLDANSSGLNPGRDIQTINGTAQSEIILSGHLDYKRYSLR